MTTYFEEMSAPPRPTAMVGTSDNPQRADYDEERILSGPAGIRLPNFLPYYDSLQNVGETQAMRLAYRRMLNDPNIKAPLLTKVFGVSALETKVNPVDRSDERQREMADFLHWNYTRRLHGGMIGLGWNILIGGLIDGYSLNEMVTGSQDFGRYKNKEILRFVKPKDVDNDVILETDPFKNVTGVKGMRYNAGKVWEPKGFIIYRHASLFGNPTGMSDLRAVYSRWWFLDTVIKLRAMMCEKRALPVIAGEYPDASKQTAVEAALAKVKSQNWLAVPKDVKLQVLDIAGSAGDVFKSFCDDLRAEIVMGIALAILQTMPGQTGQQRGDSAIHKDTSDVAKWYLSACLMQLFNDLEDGINRYVIDLNYTDVEDYPLTVIGGVDAKALMDELNLDKGLKELGFKHIQTDIESRYGRQMAENDIEALQPPPQPGMTGMGTMTGGQPQPGGDGLDALLGGATENPDEEIELPG